MAARLLIAEGAAPHLPRHVKLRHDPARGRWVLLAPERVLVPDDTALEILRSCDGAATVGTIVDGLAARYTAPRDRILADVTALLQDLADRGFLELAAAPEPGGGRDA